MNGVRIPELDGLRAIAVVLVMLYHVGLLPGGAIGVDVFFVLSGWLITGLLAREFERAGRIDLRAFWLRRARRILPPLAALLLVWGAAVTWFPALDRQAEHPWAALLSAATFTTDFRVAAGYAIGPLSHTWSLSIEEQFYLAWPLVILATRARGAAWMLAAWAALGMARAPLFLADLYRWPNFSPMHASGLLLGAALALRPIQIGRIAGVAGLALVALAACWRANRGDWPAMAWCIPLAELGTALVISAPPRWLAWPPLRAMGRVSYGAYLWHVPVLYGLGAMNPYLLLVAALGGGFGAAAISWRFVERPFVVGRARPPTPSDVASAAGDA